MLQDTKPFQLSTGVEPSSAPATSTNRPPPKRRNRQALSCTACRERKIKCDRVVPCAQCIKRGDRDLCRIEQKPKLAHDNYSEHHHHHHHHLSQQHQHHQQHHHPSPSHQHQRSSPQDSFHVEHHSENDISSAMQAYSQFSAAVSSDSSQRHVSSPPPAEVEAIKARLAQLEAMLSGGQLAMPTADNQRLSPNSGWTSGPNNGSPLDSNVSNWMHRSPGDHDLEHQMRMSFNANRPAMNFNPNLSSTQASHHRTSPYRDPNDSADEFENGGSISPRLRRRFASPTLHLNSDLPISRKEIDSDAEDAAIVLERLAMGSGPQSRANGSSQGCPLSQNAEPSCPSGDGDEAGLSEVCNEETTGGKLEKCLAKERSADMLMAEDDQIHGGGDLPGSKFEKCLQYEKQRQEQLDATVANQLEPSDTRANTEMAADASCGIPSLQENSADQPPSSSSMAGPPCACGPASQPDLPQHDQEQHPSLPVNHSNGHAHSVTCPSIAEKQASDKCAPIVGPCRMALTNEGILRLKSGPETLLGWGVGWAWASADTLLKQEKEKADEARLPYVVTERTEREAILRVICQSLPSKQIASQLIEVYESRVRYLCGHVVHIPCLRREMEAFYALDSAEKRARVVNYVDPGWLSMFLTILTLGLHFYPCQPKQGWLDVKHLLNSKSTFAWHSAAKTCLVLANYQNSNSMSVIQTIVLLYLYSSGQGSRAKTDADAGTINTALLRTAITNAQEMGLHRLGDLDKQPKPNEPSSKVVRREIGKRIWWALVFLDWSAAGSGCTKDHVVSPDRFNTPAPSNYNDDDLMMTPLPPPRPREEFTEMSYVLSNIEFVKVIREDVEIRHKREMLAATHGGDKRLTCAEAKKLDQIYRSVLEKAPSFFKVGSEIGRVTCIEVQRWLLQQGVFSKLLRIHRPSLSSRTESRSNCVLLARSILDMQKKIRSRCTVIDRLWVNLMQSFSAAIVLALHLLHSRPQLDHRISVRSEITEAIRALKQVDGSNCTAKKCIRVIEALLDEEEERWQAGNAVRASIKGADLKDAQKDLTNHKRKRQQEVELEVGNSSVGKRKNLLSLVQRVALAARGEEALATTLAPPPQAASEEEKSKRFASSASVQSSKTGAPDAADSIAVSQIQNGSNAASQNPWSWSPMNMASTVATKDDVSKAWMDQLMLPGADPSLLPLPPTYGGGSVPADDTDVLFPVLTHTGISKQHASYNFSNSNFVITDPGSRKLLAPNGVDGNPVTPPDGQGFDLSAFLEQCENSPASSSEGGNSSLQDDPFSQQFSHETQGAVQDKDTTEGKDGLKTKSGVGGLANTPLPSSGSDSYNSPSGNSLAGMVSSNHTNVTTPSPRNNSEPRPDMDSFWDWILSQGASAIASKPAPSSTVVSAVSKPETLAMPSSGPEWQHSGLTPFLGPNGYFTNLPGSNNSSTAPTSTSTASTLSTVSVASMVESVGANTDTNPKQPAFSSSSSSLTPTLPYAIDNKTQSQVSSVPSLHVDDTTTTAVEPSFDSVGTPSAGFGIETFLGGAPLYDFTDFANAWTASNPGAAVLVTPSQGPISDP